MRLIPALFLLLGCGNTYVYPVPPLGHVDGGDGSDVTLVPFGQDADGGTDNADGGTVVADDDGGVVRYRRHDAGTLDAGTSADASVAQDASTHPSSDAGPLQSLGTTCDPCKVDADCAPDHVCAYRAIDNASSCEAWYTEGGGQSCATLPYGNGLKGYRIPAGGTTIVCLINPSTRTCASWRGEFKP